MLMRYVKCLLFVVFLAFSVGAYAGTVKGKVTDSKTGEPLIGATVTLVGGGKTRTTSVNLDGTYTFRNIPAGSYKVKINFAGYKTPESATAIVKSATDVVVVGSEMKENVAELSGVEVKGYKSKESAEAARTIEKNSDLVANVMSAKTIELSPDVTVANSLQRMSGVSFASSSSGEGRYAIIRGMDARYNTTLVNGIEIPSPNNQFRYVPMNIFPADILQRLEVIKTLTPNMEANAIGGVMNLVMKDAPNKQEFKVFAAGGENTIFQNGNDFRGFYNSNINIKSPHETNIHTPVTLSNFPFSNLTLYSKSQPIDLQSGLTYGNRYLHKKLGFVLNLSYQHLFRSTNQQLISQGAQPTVLGNSSTGYVNNYPLFEQIYYNKLFTEQKRFALNNKFDYIINSKNKISLYNLYVRMDEYQTRLQSDSDITYTPPVLSYSTRTLYTKQSIYNSTVHGEHNLSPRVTLNWSAAYSVAKQDQPDYASFTYTNSYDRTTSSNVNNLYHAQDSGYGGSMSRSWAHNKDQDIAGYINLIVNRMIAHRNVEFQYGGMYRNKTRDNFYWEYSLSPSKKTTYDYSYNYSINPSVPYALSASSDTGSNGNDGKNYTVTENVAAGYAQAKFMATPKLQVIGGVRYENTDQNYSSDVNSLNNARTGHIYYFDFLPSLHLKYDLKHGQDIRASYFRSFIRPSFSEITPNFTPAGQNAIYASQGNPYLLHTTADNYDVRYGYFPKKGSDEFLVGGFLKRIYNPVEQVLYRKNITLPGGTNSGLGSLILTPFNVGEVTNAGLEFLAVKYFGHFGISINYTYTHSATTQKKFYYYYSPSKGYLTDSLNQTRPLQGQATNIGNASVLYKNKKIGLDMQLSYVYTGERIQFVSNYYNLDTWQAPFGQLDFSFTERVTKMFEVYGKVINLTNEHTSFYIKTPYQNYNGNTNAIPYQDNPNKHIQVEKDIFKTTIFLGLRFKL